jgi:hypothetical protein
MLRMCGGLELEVTFMRTLALAAATLALVACGSFPKPEARVASSEGSIRGAEEAGAKSVPEASLHLKLAQEERDKAIALMKEGENERAEYMFMRAEADAELANAIARKSAAKQQQELASDKLEAAKKKAAQ